MIVFLITILIVVGFGLYVGLKPHRDTSLTLTVTLGSHVVSQGEDLNLYLNGSNFNAPYSVNGTGFNGLCIVQTSENGTQVVGSSVSRIHYYMTQSDSRIQIAWNLTVGSFGKYCEIQNCLLPAGYYKVTEGALVVNLPNYATYTFNVINSVFQVKGVGLSLSKNDTTVSMNVNSSLVSSAHNSVNLTISNFITNASTNKQTYMNFSKNLSLPGNLTFIYEAPSQYVQYRTTIFIKTIVGTVAEVVDYGIFQ